MKRRSVLGSSVSGAASALLAGCLGGGLGDLASSDDAVSPSSGTRSALDDGCGQADHPLAELLTDDAGDTSQCTDRTRPSFAIENARDETLSVAVSLRGGDDLSETYTLEPGERVVEVSAFAVESDLTGTVTVDGHETTVEWPAQSCLRHAVALTADGVVAGWVDPLAGPGDAQHDCYAGDDAIVSVSTGERPATVTVTATDRCGDTETTETADLLPEDVERFRTLVRNGGVYDVAVDVEEGGSETYAFEDDCWGVAVHVDEGGDPEVRASAAPP